MGNGESGKLRDFAACTMAVMTGNLANFSIELGEPETSLFGLWLVLYRF
jgi:hypothetical protein